MRDMLGSFTEENMMKFIEDSETTLIRVGYIVPKLANFYISDSVKRGDVFLRETCHMLYKDAARVI